MSQVNMKQLKVQLDKFKNRVDNFQPTDDVSQNDQIIGEIEDMITNIDTLLDNIKEDFDDDEELSSQRQLLDKVQEHKNDFEIIKNKFNGKKEKAREAASRELLLQGKLTGVERKKAERDMALDLNKQVDEQGLMLDSIHKNIIGANDDLGNMNVVAKEQGEKINRTGERVLNIESKVKKTDKTFGEMDRRLCCRKCILCTGIFVLTITNIVMLFLILAKVFGWSLPKKDDSNIGIDYDYSDDIQYDKLKDNIQFIILKAGSNLTSEDKFKTAFENVKNIGIGAYWIITGSSSLRNLESSDSSTDSGDSDNDSSSGSDNPDDDLDESIKIQINNAKTYLQTFKNEKAKFNYNFFFKVSDENILNNINKANKLCEEFENNNELSIKCGLYISQTNYDKYFSKKEEQNKAPNINEYFIDNINKDDIKNYNDHEKVKLFKTNEQISLNNKNYGKIMKKN